MGLLDNFLKRKPKKDFNIENDNDDFLNEVENVENDNEFKPDFDIEEDGIKGEFKEQKNNLSAMIKNNKKIAIGVGSVLSLGVITVVAEPIISNIISSKGTMDNSEYEKTSKEVQSMAQSTIKEDNEVARIQDEERKQRIEKLKAEREAKKNQNNNSNENSNIQKENNESKQNVNDLNNNNNQNIIENKIKEETINGNNKNNNIDNNVNNSNNVSTNGNLNNQNKNLNGNVENEKINKVNSQNDSKVVEAFKNSEKKEEMIQSREYVQSNGEIKNSKIEKDMDENFNKSIKKIEKNDFTHNEKDVMDPFVQEYDGTINSRAMRNELTENMKLMKDYIEFLETKKKFEEAKLIYEKKKQKNIFEEEINKVKQDFLVEVDGMRKSMDELRNINSQLTSKLNDNGKAKELEELKKTNDELEERKLKLNAAALQKVYKIGQNYLLEETDDQGNVKIYKDGNAYKGHIIEQITPEFIKVKDSVGNTLILTISSGEEISGVYTKIEIPTPNKSEVENKDIKSTDKEKSGTKVENYSEVKKKESQQTIKENTDKVNQTKSRFLN